LAEAWQFIWEEILPNLNRGLGISLLLIFPAALGGTLLGMTVGTLRIYGPPWLARPAAVYANLFRGTPLLVQLFLIYFGLARLDIRLSPYMASLLSFILCSGAYQSEYVRGGLQSIKRGQLQAAQALGFTTFKTVLFVILPQAFRRALPGCGNEIIYLIKYSSLAYTVTCIELTGEGKALASLTFKFTEVFLMVGLYYLALVSLTSWGLKRLEERLRLPGFEVRGG
jgi:polar amino acid transport system permease protein